MKGWVRCREASQLASRALDTRLGLADRLTLRLHLAICANCARFAAQLREMRRLLREPAADDDGKDAGLSEAARARIEKELRDRS